MHQAYNSIQILAKKMSTSVNQTNCLKTIGSVDEDGNEVELTEWKFVKECSSDCELDEAWDDPCKLWKDGLC